MRSDCLCVCVSPFMAYEIALLSVCLRIPPPQIVSFYFRSMLYQRKLMFGLLRYDILYSSERVCTFRCTD
jgi:hypothetical protein